MTRALTDFDVLLRDRGAFVAGIPQGVTHEQVLDRLHAGRKPFTNTKDREKGYHDSFPPQGQPQPPKPR